MKLDDNTRKLIRLAYSSRDPELRRRAVRVLAEQLPQQPHTVMQDALEEGVVGGEEEEIEETEEEAEETSDDVPALTIFDDPEEVGKQATLDDTDRTLVRMAKKASSPALKRALLAILSQES